MRLRGCADHWSTTRASVRTVGHIEVGEPGGIKATLVPLRLGTKPVGILATRSAALDLGTLDALGGVVAIAIERSHFLAERKKAETLSQRADLASALLASFSHDLRTPVTSVRVAVTNLQDVGLPPEERRAQAQLALQELDRLTRLFQDILDMARIDAAAVSPQRQWVSPADVVDAAVAYVGPRWTSTRWRSMRTACEIQVDPRLISTALAHVLENAARYSPRGRQSQSAPGRRAMAGISSYATMGLVWMRRTSITCSNPSIAVSRRGTPLARVSVWPSRAACWRPKAAAFGARTCRDGGAQFTIMVPSSGARARRAGLVAMPSRVLVVDDEPSILATMAPLLRSRGYEVSTAMSAKACLESVERVDPDLDHPRPGLAGHGRRRGVPAAPRRTVDADHRACPHAALSPTRSARSTPAPTTT